MLLMSSGQWALTGKEVRAGSLCLFGFLQETMKETEYICEATLLSEGWGTRKTARATLLYSGIHSSVFTSCHWEAQPKAPNELKHVPVQEKKPSQNELHWFLQEPHVLIAWFKEKNKEKKAQFVASRNVFALRRKSIGNVASAINLEWNRKLAHTHWSAFGRTDTLCHHFHNGPWYSHTRHFRVHQLSFLGFQE